MSSPRSAVPTWLSACPPSLGALLGTWLGGPLGFALAACGIAGGAALARRDQRRASRIDATLERAEEEVLRLRRDAIASNRSRRDFLGSMGYETATTLSAVLGIVRELSSSELTEEQHAHVRTIRESAELLLLLVNDIQDFARIESGSLRLETLDFDLDALLDDVLDVVALRAREKGLVFVCRRDPSAHRALRGDGARLRRVLLNLLSNSVDYTQDGVVDLRLSTEPAGPGAVRLRATVRDSGLGIASCRRDEIFELHGPADAGVRYGNNATGGGLAVGRFVAREMGGDLTVESNPGEGSTFELVVRLGTREVEASEVDVDLSGVRALVVDSLPEARASVVEQLRARGAEVSELAEGTSAQTTVRRALDADAPFDLVLVARDLRGLDGGRLASKLRRNPHFEGMTVLQLGEGALVHPLRPRRLAREVATALGRELAENGLPEQARLAFDLLLVEDNFANQKAIRLTLESFGCTVDVASYVFEAMEAVALKRYDAVLMDCRMPGAAGLDAVEEMRRHQSGGDGRTPILALSADPAEGDRERALEVGMDACLAMPIRADELRAALEQWATGVPLAPDEESAGGASDELVTIDLSVLDDLRELGAGDDDVLQELVELFLEQTPPRLEELREAVDREDWPALDALARNLRSSCVHLGAIRLASFCEALEAAARESSEQARGFADELSSEFDALERELRALLA